MRSAIKFAAALLMTVAATAQVPRPSPDYGFPLADGKQVNLKDYRGKVVALAFMSTT